jgi:predicted nucleic acid-binding protein
MKRFFLDTNVLIDFLANRKPFAEAAGHLFSLSLEKKAKIYWCAISYNNIYYILRQTYAHAPAIKLLEELSDMTELVSVGEKIVSQSIQSDFRDFEDAIQYFSALSLTGLDGIVTRNTKDFSKSRLPVLTPPEALALLS